VVAAGLAFINVPWAVVVGMYYGHPEPGMHAWVEGTDRAGWFLIEATALAGNIVRRQRPTIYQRRQILTLDGCCEAGEYTAAKNEASRQLAANVGQWIPDYGSLLYAGQYRY
jgi:hypothetical protein